MFNSFFHTNLYNTYFESWWTITYLITSEWFTNIEIKKNTVTWMCAASSFDSFEMINTTGTSVVGAESLNRLEWLYK